MIYIQRSDTGEGEQMSLSEILNIRDTFPQLFSDEATDEIVNQKLRDRAEWLRNEYFPKVEMENKMAMAYGVALSIISAAASEVPLFWEWFENRVKNEKTGDV